MPSPPAPLVSTPPAAPRTRRAARLLHRLTAVLTLATAGAVVLAGSPVLSGAAAPGPEQGDDLVLASSGTWPGHPGRRIVRHTVRPGDTATGLAVRYHAWTDELRALNHLGRHGTLYVGEKVRIPVVVAAARRAASQAAGKKHTTGKKHSTKHVTHRRTTSSTKHHSRRVTHPWHLADASHAKVRRVVVKSARHHGVDPHLALAVAWQESGWQQRRISSAGAVGTMQVLPGTATWMSSYVGHPLNPYGLYDNVEAGVVLLKVLHGSTSGKKAVASYFQGLGSVQQHGMYRSTKAYVGNVVTLRKRMERGWNPV